MNDAVNNKIFKLTELNLRKKYRNFRDCSIHIIDTINTSKDTVRKLPHWMCARFVVSKQMGGDKC